MKHSKKIYSQITIIYNPRSTGDAKKQATRLHKQLSEHFGAHEVVLFPTDHQGHAFEVAKQVANEQEQSLIISVSGDGGYHEVVNGVIAAGKNAAQRVVVAVEAAGNANDHYRHIRSNDTLFEAIVAGKIQELELIEVTHTHNNKTSKLYAHSYWGLGLTSTAITELNKEVLTPVKEKMIVAKEVFNFVPITVKIEGQQLQISNIIAAKVGRMAKVLKLHKTEDAAPKGTLRLLIDSKPTRSSIVRKLIKGVTRGLEKDSQLVSRFQCEVLDDTVMQLDGEVYTVHAGDTIALSVSEIVLRTI